MLAKSAGVDVRTVGSGNIGATNVARSAGKRLGILTLLADAAKGALPVFAARTLTSDEAVVAAVGLAAVVGHVFPIFLAFRGGKGVATGLGVLAALAPAAAPLAIAVFALVFALSRIVSLASLAATASAPLAAWWLGGAPATVVAAVAIGALIYGRHAENLARLAAGTEPRFRSSD